MAIYDTLGVRDAVWSTSEGRIPHRSLGFSVGGLCAILVRVVLSHHYCFVTLCLLLSIACLSSCHPAPRLDPRTEPLLDSLDYLIDSRAHYADLTEGRLAELREALAAAPDRPSQYYATLRLARGYRSCRFDSAHKYALEAVELGRLLGPNELRAASVDLAYCYLASGLFMEASEVIRQIDRHGLSTDEWVELYRLEMKKNFDLAQYTGHTSDLSEQYRRRGLAYADSALRLLPDGSAMRLYILAHYQLEQGQVAPALRTLESYIALDGLADSDRAIAYSLMGQAYMRQADLTSAIECFAVSAEYDILSGTRETTSIGQLATLLYKKGETVRAMRYIDVALEDANYYDAKHRKTSVGDIRPVIEESRLRETELRRRQMVIYSVSLSVLCLLLGIAVVVIVVQMRRLRQATRTILLKNRDLSRTNERLLEANTIKDEYIGLSFSRQAEYMREQEELSLFVLQKLESGQYDALRKSFRRSHIVRGRKEMYLDFDETFTRLFPTFVTEYNQLFPPEEREEMPAGSAMTPEMRIFALIRVGIIDTEQIARFLNYSTNTINTYKTRAKNRSLVDNKDFESTVMNIGRLR